MRLVRFDSISATQDTKIPIHSRIGIHFHQKKAFKTEFENYIIKGLEFVSTPEDVEFSLTAGIIVKQAEEDGQWETRYCGRIDAVKGQHLLVDAVYIWLSFEREKDVKTFLVARTSLTNLYKNCYKSAVIDGQDVSKERKPIVVSEFARFMHRQAVDGAKTLQSETGLLACDLWSKHQRAMANYEAFSRFLAEFAPR